MTTDPISPERLAEIASEGWCIRDDEATKLGKAAVSWLAEIDRLSAVLAAAEQAAFEQGYAAGRNDGWDAAAWVAMRNLSEATDA